ncbi:hypothetical protein [Sphingomonas xinjiangensis]|uniref:DUF2846 domain-containing protein n=1 Tax=Sphingomonas xinjiangensis TaxID=643568 RepID=A0A840YPN2_9SPHN|nr:hypothetical protein [Sphingomonas xinjiangensis]MBB5710261.1 hypothetical protein [Sphingomonas xinjiangensis]
MWVELALLMGAALQAAAPPPIEPPPAGKARLVFYRSGSFFFGARGCSAYLEQDNRAVRMAKLGRSEFAVQDVDPGERVLSGSKSLKRPLVIEAKAGDTRYFRCEITGMSGGSRLVQAHRVEFARYRPRLDAAR